MINERASTPVSVIAISKALALLLEDFRLGSHSRIYNHHETDSRPVFEHLEHNIQELETCLSAFNHHIRLEIAHLRQRQNSLASIHRLPAELFKHIFLLRASELFVSRTDTAVIHHENTWFRDGEKSAAMKWDPKTIPQESVYSVVVSMASVSSHWCQLALSTPQLWSYLDTRHSSDVTKHLLERSKRTPLHISCSADVNEQHERQFMELVIPHLDRWKSFDSFSRGPVLFTATNAEGRLAPLLERYILHKSIQFFVIDDIPSLILERSPKLRDLHIVTFSYPLGAQVLSGLSNLSIWAMVGQHSFTMEQYELLFSASPGLETIFINGDDVSPIQASTFSVRLPNLQSISLYNIDPGITTALLHSIFPDPGKYPVIKVFGEWDVMMSTFASTYPTQPGNLLQQTLSSLTSVSVVWVTDEIEQVQYQVLKAMRESSGIQSLILEINTALDETEEIIVTLLRPDGSSILNTMELELDHGFDGDMLASSLHLCPQLEYLTITVPINSLVHKLLPMMEALTFPPLNTEIHALREVGPHLKVLTFKGLEDLRSVDGIFEMRIGPMRKSLMECSLLSGLKKLEVRYSKWPPPDSDAEAKQRLASHLAQWNTELDIIPPHGHTSL